MRRLNYLIIALMCFVLAVVAAWGIGCSPYWRPVCRHKALYAASVAGEHYPVRIVVGDLDGVRHAEAQVKIDGEWEYLRVTNGHIGIRGSKINGFVPDSYYNIQQFLDKAIGTRRK